MKKAFMVFVALLTIASSSFAGIGGGNTMDIWRCTPRISVHSIQNYRLWIVQDGKSQGEVYHMILNHRDKDQTALGPIMNAEDRQVGTFRTAWYRTLTVELKGLPRLNCTWDADASY